jgi:hypothetical protein
MAGPFFPGLLGLVAGAGGGNGGGIVADGGGHGGTPWLGFGAQKKTVQTGWTVFGKQAGDALDRGPFPGASSRAVGGSGGDYGHGGGTGEMDGDQIGAGGMEHGTDIEGKEKARTRVRAALSRVVRLD